jgi:hypothetical protein
MEEKNDEIFTKETILIILILFMFSSKILDIVLDIGKSLIYLILIIYGVNYLNPILGKKIKEIINDFINIDSDSYFIKDILSKISTNILNSINSEEKNNVYTKTEQPNIAKNTFEKKQTFFPNETTQTNRNLQNIPETTNRKLS